MTGMIELADKYIKTTIVNLVHIYISIMRNEIENIKMKKIGTSRDKKYSNLK